MTDGLVVELAVDDPGACPVAGAADAAVEHPARDVSRAVATDDEGHLAEEFTLPAGVDPDDPDVDRVASFADRDVYRFTRDASDPCVCDRLETVGGPVTDVHARDGTLYVTIHATDADLVSDAVAELREAFGGVRVTRLRNSTDTVSDDLVLVDSADLTDRQREVLEAAHEMGYFDYPKGANAGEVAETLDISPSTFSEHLAAAQGKVLDALIDE